MASRLPLPRAAVTVPDIEPTFARARDPTDVLRNLYVEIVCALRSPASLKFFSLAPLRHPFLYSPQSRLDRGPMIRESNDA